MKGLQAEIDALGNAIKAALWQMPADVELAKTLISRRMGLRILAREVPVKLRPPPREVEIA